MVKQRVVKETLADGTEWYYPESRFLWLFWRRHYTVCGVHAFGSEEGAWYYFKSQREKREEEKVKRAAKKTVNREVCK